jgi:hypothetical protein
MFQTAEKIALGYFAREVAARLQMGALRLLHTSIQLFRRFFLRRICLHHTEMHRLGTQHQLKYEILRRVRKYGYFCRSREESLLGFQRVFAALYSMILMIHAGRLGNHILLVVNWNSSFLLIDRLGCFETL